MSQQVDGKKARDSVLHARRVKNMIIGEYDKKMTMDAICARSIIGVRTCCFWQL